MHLSPAASCRCSHDARRKYRCKRKSRYRDVRSALSPLPRSVHRSARTRLTDLPCVACWARDGTCRPAQGADRHTRCRNDAITFPMRSMGEAARSALRRHGGSRRDRRAAARLAALDFDSRRRAWPVAPAAPSLACCRGPRQHRPMRHQPNAAISAARAAARAVPATVRAGGVRGHASLQHPSREAVAAGPVRVIARWERIRPPSPLGSRLAAAERDEGRSANARP
jgi:hypothetical protein